jgi:hypothetical protein
MHNSEVITKKVAMMKKSAIRLETGMELPDSKEKLQFIRCEAWLHFKRSFELLLLLIRQP